MVRKYGANILELTPIQSFENVKTYLDIIKVVNQKYPNQFLYTLNLLSHKVNEVKLTHNKDINLDIEVNGENRIVANYHKKMLDQFIDLLASKKK